MAQTHDNFLLSRLPLELRRELINYLADYQTLEQINQFECFNELIFSTQTLTSSEEIQLNISSLIRYRSIQSMSNIVITINQSSDLDIIHQLPLLRQWIFWVSNLGLEDQIIHRALDFDCNQKRYSFIFDYSCCNQDLKYFEINCGLIWTYPVRCFPIYYFFIENRRASCSFDPPYVLARLTDSIDELKGLDQTLNYVNPMIIHEMLQLDWRLIMDLIPIFFHYYISNQELINLLVKIAIELFGARSLTKTLNARDTDQVWIQDVNHSCRIPLISPIVKDAFETQYRTLLNELKILTAGG